MKFRDEIKRFRVWADGVQDPSGEWELEYPDWPNFEAAFFTFLKETNNTNWDAQDWRDVLYAVARDNECENFIDKISKDKHLLKNLAVKATKSEERDAKWQIAACLGQVAELEFAEPILLLLVDDADEYVRRRALAALSVLGSKETERLAILAWETGRLYQRIAALHALKNIRSSKLDHFLELAKQDGRAHLVTNASKIEEERKGRNF